MGFERESEWRDRLKSILENDFGYKALSEVTFTNPSDRGRIDLYVIPPASWPHKPYFPCIGIETKIFENEGMGWLIESKDQMKRYMNPENKFKQNGIIYSPLSICLVATPESWHEGYVYKWNAMLKSGNWTSPDCWETMTFIFQRILLKVGCSILLNKRFESNKTGGSIRTYYLGE